MLKARPDQDTLLRNIVADTVAQQIQKCLATAAKQLRDNVSYPRPDQYTLLRNSPATKYLKKSLSRSATIQICCVTVAQEFRDTILRVSVCLGGYGKHETKLRTMDPVVTGQSSAGLACEKL